MLLYQPINGYCYNSDTYCLLNFLEFNLKKFKNIYGELLDIGSGSGILGLHAVNKFGKLTLNSCEVQKSFAFLSQKNAQINNIEINLYFNNFSNLNFDKKFDIIISNPPFYPASVVKTNNENIKIARYNDNLPLDVFIAKTSKILKENGKFFFCYDVKLLNDIILLLKSNKLNLEAMQFLHPKKDKKASLIMIYARKNSKSSLDILPPLVMFDKGNFTEEMLDIYSKYKTHSIKVEI